MAGLLRNFIVGVGSREMLPTIWAISITTGVTGGLWRFRVNRRKNREVGNGSFLLGDVNGRKEDYAAATVVACREGIEEGWGLGSRVTSLEESTATSIGICEGGEEENGLLPSSFMQQKTG